MSTNIQAYFMLAGEFDVKSASQTIGISATEIAIRGKMGKYCINKTDRWILGTDFKETLNLDEALNFISLLAEKTTILKKIKSDFNLTASLQVVVNIEDGALPGLYIPEQVTEFLGHVSASISIDLYGIT